MFPQNPSQLFLYCSWWQYHFLLLVVSNLTWFQKVTAFYKQKTLVGLGLEKLRKNSTIYAQNTVLRIFVKDFMCGKCHKNIFVYNSNKLQWHIISFPSFSMMFRHQYCVNLSLKTTLELLNLGNMKGVGKLDFLKFTSNKCTT